MHDLKGCAQLYNWNRITIRWCVSLPWLNYVIGLRFWLYCPPLSSFIEKSIESQSKGNSGRGKYTAPCEKTFKSLLTENGIATRKLNHKALHFQNWGN